MKGLITKEPNKFNKKVYCRWNLNNLTENSIIEPYECILNKSPFIYSNCTLVRSFVISITDIDSCNLETLGRLFLPEFILFCFFYTD